MNVYPVLNPDSLRERCMRDIAQFKVIYPDNNPQDPEGQVEVFTFDLVTSPEGVTKESMQTTISVLTTYIDTHCRGTYVARISEIASKLQNQLWVARTYLVYQIFIFLTLSIGSNPELYNSIYTDIDRFPFRANVVELLLFIKLGIFGSLTPTSDVDVGFQYSGRNLNYEPCLAYIVSRFECLFLIFTGKSCLDFDVESYADMITVPNYDADSETNPDLFYLDSSKLPWDDKTASALLPMAFNSIIRNAALVNNPPAVPHDLTFKSVVDLFSTFPAYRKSLDKGSLELPYQITKLAIDKSIYPAIFEKAKVTIADFLSKDYETQRYAYYEKVKVAETLKVTILNDKKTKKELMTLTAEQIRDIMIAIGDALTLRMESYTCVSTVIHVVRVLQAQATVEKYNTTAPKEVCSLSLKGELEKPRCVVGKAGFTLSALEQMGYMYRFHQTYCVNDGVGHYNEEKCKKKIGKYNTRLIDAITRIRSTAGGGKTYTRSNSISFSNHNKTKRLYSKSVKPREKHLKNYNNNCRRYSICSKTKLKRYPLSGRRTVKISKTKLYYTKR